MEKNISINVGICLSLIKNLRPKGYDLIDLNDSITKYMHGNTKRRWRKNFIRACEILISDKSEIITKKDLENFKEFCDVKKGIVYCVECQGYYKFGVTSGLIRKRLSQLKTGNPFDIALIWSVKSNHIYKHEKQIHKIIKNNHHKGEWYDIPSVLAKELRNMVKYNGTT